MAVQYHTHVFEIPTATTDDVAEGTSNEIAVTPASLAPTVETARTAVQPYPSVADMPGIELPVSTDSLRVDGYYAAGDGGAALYAKAGSEPSHTAKFQTADGAWWGLSSAPSISLKALGAKANGVDFEDVALLNSMMASAAEVGIKVFDGLDRQLRLDGSTPLVVPTGCTLRNVEIDGQAMASGSKIVECISTQGAELFLTADALYGTNELNIASTSGFAAGNWIYVGSNKIWASPTSVKCGELVQVRSVASATKLLLLHQLSNDYLVSDGASLKKQNAEYSDITLRDGRIIGGGAGLAHYAANFECTPGVKILDMSFEDCEDRFLSFNRCPAPEIIRPRMSKATGSLGYGVALVFGCRDALIDGMTGAWMRHAVTIGGTDGVNINTRAVNNRLHHMMDAGLDAHAAALAVEFSHNTIEGDWGYEVSGNGDGIICQGADFTAIGNKIKHAKRTGVFHQHQVSGSKAPSRTRIVGNDFERCGQSAVTVQNTVSRAMGQVNVQGNTAYNIGSLVQTAGAIYIYAQSGSIRGVSVSGNGLDQVDTTGVFLRADAGQTLEGVKDIDNSVFLTDAAKVVPRYPHLRSAAGTMKDIVTMASVTNATVTPYNGAEERSVVVGNAWFDDYSSDAPNLTAATNKVVGLNASNDDASVTLTIASGAITLPVGPSDIIVDTEGAAATDDLTDIFGARELGKVIILRSANNARDVVVKNDNTKIRLGGADFTLSTTWDKLVLHWNGSLWVRLTEPVTN